MLAAGLCMALLPTACTGDFLSAGGSGDSVPPGEEGLFTFRLSTGIISSVTTKATDENTLHDIWAVQLNTAGTAALMPPVRTEVNDGKIRVLLKAEASKLYFFANTNDDNLFDPQAALSTFTTASVEAVRLTCDRDWGAAYPYMPMTGTWEGMPTVPAIIGTVELTRAFAILRIQVKRIQPAAASFGFTSLQLKNVPDVLCLCPTASGTYPAATGTYINYPVNTNTSPMYSYPVYTFYVPENCRGTGSERFETEKNGTSLGAAKDYATCYEIKGEYGGVRKLYRFYLGENNTNDYNIKRNHIYTVTITLAGEYELDWRIESDPIPASVSSGTSVSWGSGGSQNLEGNDIYWSWE